MVKHYIQIFSVLFFFSSSLFSQQASIDFSNNSDIFVGFSGSSFSKTTNPEDSSDDVGQFSNNGAEAWQGAYHDLTIPVDLSLSKEISFDFYKFDQDAHQIIMKLERGANADVEVKVDIPAGNANEWNNNVQFVFPSNSAGSYSRMTLFIDGGVANKPSASYLIDDINYQVNSTDPNAIDVEYTNLVWSDEFDGGALDTDKWHHQTFGPQGGGWFNGEFQHYTDSPTNSFVSEGNLHIVAKKETIELNGVSRDFTSARLNSKFAFTYGRVDVRAKLPEGDGTWPAIWTLGKNVLEQGAYWQTQGYGTTPWPATGEIDIMEHGLHGTNVVSSALHTPSSSGNTFNTATKALPNVAENYHVYSMNWSPNQITFLIDGVGYYTYKPSTQNMSTWPFDLDQFLLLNVAIGGFSGTPAADFTQSSMLVDYVRVYQGSNLGVDDVFGSEFLIYPNPSSEVIHIKSDKKINRIEMYSSIGQLVKKQENVVNTINTSTLKSGLYVIKIYSENRIATKKVIIK